MIKFNQPVITGTMDNYCWAWGGGTNSTWSTGSNWYKWDGSKWAIQSSSYPDAGSKVYILPSLNTCVTNGAINASASFGDLNIQGGSFDLGSANTSITGDIINDGGTLCRVVQELLLLMALVLKVLLDQESTPTLIT